MAFKTAITLIVLFMGVVTVSARKATTGVIFFAMTSTLAAILFTLYKAPDVALAEAAIGAAFTSFLYLIALQHKGKLWVALVEVEGGVNALENWILERFCERHNLELKLAYYSDISEAKEKLNLGEVEMIGGGIVADPSFIHTIPFLETKLLLLAKSDKDIEEKDLTNKADIFVIDLMRYRSLLLSDFGSKMKILKQIDGMGYVFVVREDDKMLLKQLNDFISEIKNKGELKKAIGRFIY